MAPHALVVGGTGPTGIWIVHGLVTRGYDVTILHRGAHERAETPASVTHLHHDPYDEADLATALTGRTFDVVVAMYGRLRRVAELTRGGAGTPPTSGSPRAPPGSAPRSSAPGSPARTSGSATCCPA